MPDTTKTVFFDQQVGSQIITLFDESRKYLLVVTPYIDLWGHAKLAIERAIKRGVDVKFMLRADPESLARGSARESVAFLLANNVKVLAVERLHAKIYLNESKIIVASMNLHSSSDQGSLEVGVLITRSDEQQVIKRYIKENLEGIAAPLVDFTWAQAPIQSASRQTGSVGVQRGHCIRCGRPVGLDPGHPLCDGCYDVWAEWKDIDYREQVCHSCGRPAEVSYAKPLCWDCYQRLS